MYTPPRVYNELPTHSLC